MLTDLEASFGWLLALEELAGIGALIIRGHELLLSTVVRHGNMLPEKNGEELSFKSPLPLKTCSGCIEMGINTSKFFYFQQTLSRTAFLVLDTCNF